MEEILVEFEHHDDEPASVRYMIDEHNAYVRKRKLELNPPRKSPEEEVTDGIVTVLKWGALILLAPAWLPLYIVWKVFCGMGLMGGGGRKFDGW